MSPPSSSLFYNYLAIERSRKVCDSLLQDMYLTLTSDIFIGQTVTTPMTLRRLGGGSQVLESFSSHVIASVNYTWASAITGGQVEAGRLFNAQQIRAERMRPSKTRPSSPMDFTGKTIGPQVSTREFPRLSDGALEALNFTLNITMYVPKRFVVRPRLPD